MRKLSYGLAVSASLCAMVFADAAQAQQPGDAPEVIIVTGSREVYNNAAVTENMLAQQSPITSQLSAIDNLPGVSVQEGDAFGFDDWSTTIALRGFQTNLDEQQIGITIDGLPNGNSNYGGGAKPNRYIDSANTGGIVVSQGTSDIASRSNEALGGTLDFRTDDPTDARRMRFSVSLGQFEAQRFYARFDSGDLGGVKFWVSGTHQEATDWVNASAENRRDHVAAKAIADFDAVTLTAYASYDDTHEDNYQRLFSPADFASNPEWDQLTDTWGPIPYVNQLYRRGWSTLRENFFAYLKAESDLGSGVTLKAGGYYHKNSGRGDWVPPYIVNVNYDGDNSPDSELFGARYQGGAPIADRPRIYFVDAQGIALTPTAGCESTITFPYGGAGADYDPGCYPANAVPVQSYRHTHYDKSRLGFTLDGEWNASFGDVDNLLRAGIWYEDTTREEHRDWHKITDARIGYEYDSPAYWTQYSYRFPQDTMKLYLENQMRFAGVTATVGIKQFLANVAREDQFGQTSDIDVNTDSDILFSGGLQWETPLPGLEIFGGYAKNFKAISDTILERPASDISNLEPETARNIDVGARYDRPGWNASISYYDIKFDNRIIFLAPNSDAGPNYLIGTNGTYFNGGGITSRGIEAAVNARLTRTISAFSSYTYTKAEYLGTGDAGVDAENGIVPGNRVTGIPKHMYVASLNWADGPFKAGISGKYTGARYVNLANSWATDSYVLVDLNVGVEADEVSDVLKGFRMDLTVNNVFDKDYLGGISGGGAWIGAPRTVVFTLTGDF